MIFYFSGTGNSKWIATQLAKKLNDKAVNIVDVKDKQYLFLDNEKVGIVFPVYAWNPPQIVIEFIKNIKVCGTFVYGICTCGEDAGHTMKKLNEILPLNLTYSIVMPSNYNIGMQVDSEEEAKKKIAAAKNTIDIISREVDIGLRKTEVNKGSFAFLKTTLGGFWFQHLARSTKPFYAKEDCNSCGLCAKVCPLKTITISEGKPVWGKECYQCLACINRCPKQAIEYGKASKGKGRYYFKYDEI